MKKFLLAIFCGLLCLTALAAETIPPAPAKYFNDYAGVVSSATAEQLNQQLKQFERDTSSQLVVAVYPKMQSDSSIEDYTVRVAQSWGVGQKDKKNGAVLFVFTQDHKMFLQVGYGLEGALPDALGKRIIADEITPSFKSGNYTAGLTAGVNAILAATKGEYKGNGNTVAEFLSNPIKLIQAYFPFILFAGFFGLFFFINWKVRSHHGNWHGFTISNGGYSSGGCSSGGSWSSGGGGGGGSDFSGGGGSFGGGGAGGSW